MEGAAWSLYGGISGDPALAFCLKLGVKRSLNLAPQHSPQCTHKEVNGSPLWSCSGNARILTLLLNKMLLATGQRADDWAQFKERPVSSFQVSSPESQWMRMLPLLQLSRAAPDLHVSGHGSTRDHLEGGIYLEGIYLETCGKSTEFFFICFKCAMKIIKLGEMSKY